MKAFALSALIFLAAAEVLIAATGVDWNLLAPLLYYQGVDLPVHRPSENPALLYELVPGYAGDLDGRRITVNSLGFRGPERARRKPAGVLRVVCLGSSNTYGATVGDGDAYPALTEALLNARGGKTRFEVWNAGVSGYSVTQSAAAGELIAEADEPDLFIFQMHSTRRRPFLLGRPFARYFDAEPSLYLENLRLLPLGGRPLDAALLRRWRLWRALVIAANRLAPGAANNPRYDNKIAPAEGLCRLRRGRVPIVLLRNPGRGTPDACEEGLPVIDLEASLPKNYSADYLLIHPPAYVYRWYAKTIAERLSASGALRRGS
jgi:hypothetical protein